MDMEHESRTQVHLAGLSARPRRAGVASPNVPRYNYLDPPARAMNFPAAKFSPPPPPPNHPRLSPPSPIQPISHSL